MVKDGGVATYSVNQYDLGKKTAKMTVEILKGKKKPATTPIAHITKGEPVLNLKEAKKLGIKVPTKFMNECKKEGEIYR